MNAPAVRAGARDLLADCHRFACISECRQFRYLLSRRWAPGPSLLFVMLNPSTADGMVDDATIRRCVTFANVHEFGTLEVVNLFAFRATEPADLARLGWQVGPENDVSIDGAARNADAVCVAWGANGSPAVERRVQEVMPIIVAAGREPQCLRITRNGYPQHPLYLPSTARLQPFDLSAIEEAMQP